RDVPLTLKTLTASTVGGTVALGRALAPALTQMGRKLSGTLAGKAAGTLAAHTGAKVGGKVGGKVLGATMGIGIVLWDVWDHRQPTQVVRPRLRQAIADYLTEVKQQLLYMPESGVIALLHTLEGSLIASRRPQASPS